VWTIVGDVAAMVAALGAVGGLIAVVIFGNRALREAKATVAEAKEAREAAHSEHELEMEERRKALEAEVNLRRIEQLALALTTTAELEQVATGSFQPGPTELQLHGDVVAAEGARRATMRQRLPEVAAKLKAVLVGLEAFGGPKLEELDKVANDAIHNFGSYEQTANGAREGIKQLTELLRAAPVKPGDG